MRASHHIGLAELGELVLYLEVRRWMKACLDLLQEGDDCKEGGV